MCPPSSDSEDLGGVGKLPQELNLVSQMENAGGAEEAPVCPQAESSEGLGPPQRASLPLSTQTFSLSVMYLLVKLLSQNWPYPSYFPVALVTSMAISFHHPAPVALHSRLIFSFLVQPIPRATPHMLICALSRPVP